MEQIKLNKNKAINIPKLKKRKWLDVDGGIYNYKGGGHLMVKSGLNQNNNNLIEYIGIGYLENEE